MFRGLVRMLRGASALTRRFDGAVGGRRGCGMGTFGTINPEVSAANFSLRSRARYLAVNNPWVSQAVANWVGALVGSGIVAESKHTDESVRKAQNAAFNSWGDDSDADGRTDFPGQQADVARSVVIDGEAFVQMLTTPHGLRLRLIPPDLVDESRTMNLANGGFVVQGIEFDASGRRVAYHILPYRPADLWATYATPIRVPAEDILHVFKPLAAGQVRGVSWMAPIILSAAEFDQLLDALLMGCKIAAMHAGFLTDANGASAAPYDGTQTDSILQTGLEPGTLKVLPPGVDIKFNTPAQVNEVAALIKLNLQQLAAGLGLPEHLVSGDLTGANYSSLRAGLLPFRQRVEQIQYGIFVPQFLRPTWRRVLTITALMGEVEFDSNMPVDWMMPRPMQVDPLKDVQATTAEIDAGLTSRRKAVAERGWNIEDLDVEIAADHAREKSLGLNFETPPPATPNPEPDNVAAS